MFTQNSFKQHFERECFQWKSKSAKSIRRFKKYLGNHLPELNQEQLSLRPTAAGNVNVKIWTIGDFPFLSYAAHTQTLISKKHFLIWFAGDKFVSEVITVFKRNNIWTFHVFILWQIKYRNNLNIITHGLHITHHEHYYNAEFWLK